MNWKLLFGGVLILGLAAIVGLFLVLRPPSPESHRIFINGHILSMDEDNRVYEAMSIRGTRIEKLGSNEEISSLIARETKTTDLHGMTLLPGFVDAHGHFPGSAMSVVAEDLNSPPIGDVASIAQLQERMRQRAATTDAGDWVMGSGYDDTMLAEGRHPTREDLDAVSTQHPVYVSHISGHMGVANSLALAAVGIDASTEDPPGGVVVRKAGSSEPAGLLEETAHMATMKYFMAKFSGLDFLNMTRMASAEYVSRGVTTAQSGGADENMARGLALLARLRLIAPRLIIFPFQDSLGPKILDGSFVAADYENRLLQIGAIKIIADGSIQGYTGYLSHPYHVPFKGDASYRGYPTLQREELIEIVGRFHRARHQLAIHANGDAAIDDVLDAFELAQKANPIPDPRMILIHAQMAREDQLLRMKRLGVTPSFFSAHTYYWGDRHRDIFMGPQRAARMSPTRSAQDLGLRYSVHLDTPVVPMQPLQLLWSTVNRKSTSGAVIGPEQRVGVLEALRAMTIDAAWQVFQDVNRGSLEPGKFADLVILSGNPLDDPESIRELEVMETFVGGVSVYRRQ
jgi:predicted amidohydrolase YtcJ